MRMISYILEFPSLSKILQNVRSMIEITFSDKCEYNLNYFIYKSRILKMRLGII